MRISLNWLKDYIDLPKVTAKKLAHDLTMSTVEVEAVIDQAKAYENMVVGKVKMIKSHPNADRLRIVMTDIGREVKQIVCGGENLSEGMLVAVALPGAKVRWHGQGDPVILEKTKIRGEESFGMICASTEIGLGDIYPNSEKEILDISFCKKKPGTSLAKALGLNDIIIEIDNKSLTNRPDLWSHQGIARELAAIYKVKLKDVPKSPISTTKSNKELDIKIKSDKCRSYLGLVVNNLEIKPSPVWMQVRLIAVGLRPINNIVDLTNYVMLDVGEPMHAFDYENVGNKIIVRLAKSGEILKTLDGEDQRLESEDLIIANETKPIALAGIKGGFQSGVQPDTKKVIIEAANFDSLSIRKTSARLNIRTDASMRHEKALDLERPLLGMSRFIYLLKQIAPSVEISKVVCLGKLKTPSVSVEVSLDFINKRLGKDLTKKEIKDILTRLGFKVIDRGKIFNIKVPSWRATGDISIPEDIVEEVGRIYGYDNLGMQPLKYQMEKAVFQPQLIWQNKIKLFLSHSAGLNELYSYPWADDRMLGILGIKKDNLIQISNPPAANLAYLQNSLLPNLLLKIEYNNKFFPEFGLFEMANVFENSFVKKNVKQINRLPYQSKNLLFAVVGEGNDIYFKGKGILEALFSYLKLSGWKYEENSSYKFLEQDQRFIIVGDKAIGYLGSLKKEIVDKLDLKSNELKIVLVELNLDKLLLNFSPQLNYQPLPQFPSVVRDLAFELNKDVTWQTVYDLIAGADDLIQKVEFLSVYDLGEKKSLAVRIEYAAKDRTLTSEEVAVIEKNIIKLVEQKLKGNLRG